VLLVGVALLIYAPRLGDTPAYLTHDEVIFTLHARSVAFTGRDLNGRLLPLFFQIPHVFWATPFCIYFAVPFLRFLPLSEAVIRLPSLVVGLIDIVLMYFVARHTFKSERAGIVAAVLLTLTPAHLINSRMFLDPLYPVPFVLAWMLCLVIYLQRRQVAVLFIGMVLLGIGFYTYHASVVMMPLYCGLSLLVLWVAGERSMRPYAVALAGFCLPLIPLAPWLLTHPQHYRDQVQFFGIYDANRFNPLQGAHELLSYVSLTARVGVYWNYFNPSLLFFSGDTAVIHSTRQAGVFLLPIAAFLVAGIWHTGRMPRPIALLLLAGFLCAPIPPTLANSGDRIARALVMLPMAIVLATYGVEWFLTDARRGVRIIGVCLLALVPLQFTSFYRDYLTDYRRRSGIWFEGNIRGGLEEIIARDAPPHISRIYLPTNIAFIEMFWQLYLDKHGRTDLVTHTTYFDPAGALTDVPAGALILTRILSDGRVEVSGFKEIARLPESGGRSLFAVLQR
jgi:4-amino-4-deoxy-L-arabinose transferase-like glycosyltransferase